MAVNVVIKNLQFKTGVPYRTDKLIINPHCPLIEFLSFHWWRTDYKDTLAQSFLLPVSVLQGFGGFLENFTVLVCFYGVWFGFLLLSVSVLLSCPPLLLSATWVTFLLFPCVFVSSFLLGLQFVFVFFTYIGHQILLFHPAIGNSNSIFLLNQLN